MCIVAPRGTTMPAMSLSMPVSAASSRLVGMVAEEEQVPSTNELAKLYTINPATAAKGVNLLVDEGILYKRRGIGMFVAPGAEQAVRAKRKAAFYDSYVRPLVKEGASLAVTGEELLAMVRRAIEEGEAK